MGHDLRIGRLEIEFTWTDDVRQFYSRFAYRLPTMLSDMTRIAQSPHLNMPPPQQIDKAGIRTRLSCLGLSTFRVVKRAYWVTGVIGPKPQRQRVAQPALRKAHEYFSDYPGSDRGE